MHPLPPQAYTKETLAKAFAWLQTQPENIKELAASTDVLVSLYLKAKLNGESALDRPSIQNFKSELKSLAGMMGEFEEDGPSRTPYVPPSQQVAPPPPSFSAAQASSSQRIAPTVTAPLASAPIPPRLNADSHNTSNELRFDPRTTSMIHEVKEGFNLSSDSEALRLLISVGFKSLKKL